MKWYIAGPMSGKPKFNIPAFIEARMDLVTEGFAQGTWEVLCPHDNLTPDEHEEAMLSLNGDPGSHGKPYALALADDIHNAIVRNCNHLLLLPDWQRSRGARVEAYLALSLDWRIFLTPKRGVISRVHLQDYVLKHIYMETLAL